MPSAPASRTLVLYEANCLSIGGNQRSIELLVRTWPAEAGRLVVICPTESPLTEIVRAAGGEVLVVEQPPRLARYNQGLVRAGRLDKALSLLSLLGYNLRMARVLRGLGADAILCNNVRSLLMLGLAARWLRVPAAWHIKVEMEKFYTDFWIRAGLRLARRVMVISPAVIPRLCRDEARRVEVLPIGVDAAALAHAAEGAAPKTGKTILFAGYLRQGKGIEDLLRAMARVAAAHPDARLDVAGEAGEPGYQAHLEHLAADLGVTERVRFLGWRRDVPRLLAEADLYVLPSHSEGVPRSVVEAMLLGTPVVATAVGGVPDMLRDGTLGDVVPVGDPDALAAAMDRLLADPAGRAATAARAREAALATYTIDRHRDRLLQIVTEMRAETA